jgi:short subunit dehydrogenase-like uncharacterized protein
MADTAAARDARQYDVLLWGATGYTGRLVAEFLLGRYGAGSKLRWALGGRNRAKLEAIRGELAGAYPHAAKLPIVLGDATDRASLDALVRQTRVVCTTVGPYALHGRELVAACVDAGTDYCDLTGETTFVRETIDLHHERARNGTGARIVPCCGFDSIPSDLGTLLVQEHTRATYGGSCGEVKCFVMDATGGLSGGTVASMATLAEQAARDRRARRLMADPYALVPDGERPVQNGSPPRHREADQWNVRWDDDIRRWTGPFLMAAINTRVVRRTSALLGYPWGRDFRYSEAMSFSSGPRGWLAATRVAAGLGMLLGGLSVAPVRWALSKTVLPAPGEGPSKERRERGHFALRFVGTRRADNGSPPENAEKVLATVRGKSDPGYTETAKMLGESAVCLALDGDGVAKEGGVLTPASCMGMRLVQRLRDVGISFEVEDD